MWPFRRKAAPAPPSVRQPGWRRLPAIQRMVTPIPLTVGTTSFSDSLVSWHNPSRLAGLGHAVLPDAPAGQVSGLARRAPATTTLEPHTPALRSSGDGLDLGHSWALEQPKPPEITVRTPPAGAGTDVLTGSARPAVQRSASLTTAAPLPPAHTLPSLAPRHARGEPADEAVATPGDEQTATTARLTPAPSPETAPDPPDVAAPLAGGAPVAADQHPAPDRVPGSAPTSGLVVSPSSEPALPSNGPWPPRRLGLGAPLAERPRGASVQRNASGAPGPNASGQRRGSRQSSAPVQRSGLPKPEPDQEPACEPVEVAPLLDGGTTEPAPEALPIGPTPVAQIDGGTTEPAPEGPSIGPTPVAPTVEVPLNTAPSAAPVPSRPLVGATAQRSALATPAGPPRFDTGSPAPKPPAGRPAHADLVQRSASVQRSPAVTSTISAAPALVSAPTPIGTPAVMSESPQVGADWSAVRRVADGVPAGTEGAEARVQRAAASSATAAAPEGRSAAELDDLARRLYERITTRLKAELRLDRERAGLT